jgi:hypothetical protein
MQGCCGRGGETVGEVMVAGLEVRTRCLVFVCQGEGAPWLAAAGAGPALACCPGEPGRQAKGEGRGAPSWRGARRGVAA